jgi:hypothetical protein
MKTMGKHLATQLGVGRRRIIRRFAGCILDRELDVRAC